MSKKVEYSLKIFIRVLTVIIYVMANHMHDKLLSDLGIVSHLSLSQTFYGRSYYPFSRDKRC